MLRENSAISIEVLRQQDLPAALELQKEAYPSFLVEEEAVFVSRIDLAASYCFAAWHDEKLLGYILAHGWTRQSPPALGALLAAGVPSEVLFIHDLAVSPSGRVRGIGQKLITRVIDRAAQDGLCSAELIAVEGAANYWRQFGFAEPAVPVALLEKLRTYGSLARWMTREITLNP